MSGFYAEIIVVLLYCVDIHYLIHGLISLVFANVLLFLCFCLPSDEIGISIRIFGTCPDVGTWYFCDK